MPKILTHDEIAESINLLNSKQREAFNVIHTWPTDYVKYDGINAEPVHIFISDTGGRGKSHMAKLTYNAISKILLYYCKDPEKPRVLLVGPTGA